MENVSYFFQAFVQMLLYRRAVYLPPVLSSLVILITIVSLFTIHVFTLLIPFHLSHVECKFHGTKQCFVQIYFYFHTYVQLQMHSYTCIYDRSWWEYIRKNLKISVCVFEIL